VADAWGRRQDTLPAAWRRGRSICSRMGTQLREGLSAPDQRGRCSTQGEPALQPSGTFPGSLGTGAYVVSDDAVLGLHSMLHRMRFSYGSASLHPVVLGEISWRRAQCRPNRSSQRQEMRTPDLHQLQEQLTNMCFALSLALTALSARATGLVPVLHFDGHGSAPEGGC
jgi:hypothetical protein